MKKFFKCKAQHISFSCKYILSARNPNSEITHSFELIAAVGRESREANQPWVIFRASIVFFFFFFF